MYTAVTCCVKLYILAIAKRPRTFSEFIGYVKIYNRCLIVRFMLDTVTADDKKANVGTCEKSTYHPTRVKPLVACHRVQIIIFYTHSYIVYSILSNIWLANSMRHYYFFATVDVRRLACSIFN